MEATCDRFYSNLAFGRDRFILTPMDPRPKTFALDDDLAELALNQAELIEEFDKLRAAVVADR